VSKSGIRVPGEKPWLDLVSFGRRGPGERIHFLPTQIAQISRTVRRVPEVMVKVSGGATTLRGVKTHLQYIGREGELEIETDEGERRRDIDELVKDWALDLEILNSRQKYSGVPGRRATKLVHNIVLSMPAGTSALKLQKAVRHFAQEQFGLVHRYAMVLHTDQKHPHVHLVVKAVSEDGMRLNIRKATLHQWREHFARALRAQGIEANATNRCVRGRTETRKNDGIFRAMQRGVSTHWRERVMRVARELQAGTVRVEPGKQRLVATRRDIDAGWRAVGQMLQQQGERALAVEVARFVEKFPVPRTEKEYIAYELLEHRQRQREAREWPISR
jgi:Relaxase/Mobilisation nuclease domain